MPLARRPADPLLWPIASAQEAILAAFQARGWPADFLRNPLPRERGETNAEWQQRLRNMVENLNRGLPRGTIRFRTEGNRVRWQFDGPVGNVAHRRPTGNY